MMVSDAFKDKLYERVGVKLEQVVVGSNSSEEIVKIKRLLYI